jgi:hypothetical protein
VVYTAAAAAEDCKREEGWDMSGEAFDSWWLASLKRSSCIHCMNRQVDMTCIIGPSAQASDFGMQDDCVLGMHAQELSQRKKSLCVFVSWLDGAGWRRAIMPGAHHCRCAAWGTGFVDHETLVCRLKRFVLSALRDGLVMTSCISHALLVMEICLASFALQRK